ncbi:MAG: RagB/SusD family nutrient uptake outer membrane protein [Paludibacteraceae bacterium]|nr:RagB/SusD family nutrient uptake outer membrane protein [Paludibacteraceae bacterium]
MKRIKYLLIVYLAFALVSTLCQSCSEDTLDSKIYDKITPDNFFSNESDLIVATNALYAPFTTDWGYDDGNYLQSIYNGDPVHYLGLQGLTTDEAYSPWSSTNDYRNFLIGPATFNSYNSKCQHRQIRFIARATDLIDQIGKCKVSPDISKKYIAEAKAIRAFLAWYLYDMFGPVNAIFDPAILTSLDPLPRPSQQEFVAQIIKDATESIVDLPESTNGTPNWGRMNKNTARMVLVRTYMHEKNWAKVAEVCSDIENSDKYSLLPEYRDVFNIQQNKELIYAAVASAKGPNFYITEANDGDVGSANGGLIGRIPSGWKGLYMPWAFYDKYQAGDHRLQTIVAEYTNKSGKLITRADMTKGAFPLKFTDFSKVSGSGYILDHPVFRYAEVLLSHGEALNEMGDLPRAIAMVKKVTDRAFTTIPATGVSSSADQASFRNFIFDERGRELYCEWVRRTDLIRQGTFISGAVARGINAKDHQVLFPIPDDVILQSKGVVTQNPGY